MLHEKREELHGITVVMTGASGKTYLGRFHETTERGVALRDVAIHDPATAGQDLAAWLEGQKRFGIKVASRLLVVPASEAAAMVRFSEGTGER